MSEEVNSLRENFVSLESAKSNAESKFQSTLSDYKDQQEKLEKEITCYQETESALYNARAEYNTVKGELQSCIEELAKVSLYKDSPDLFLAKVFSFCRQRKILMQSWKRIVNSKNVLAALMKNTRLVNSHQILHGKTSVRWKELSVACKRRFKH